VIPPPLSTQLPSAVAVKVAAAAVEVYAGSTAVDTASHRMREDGVAVPGRSLACCMTLEISPPCPARKISLHVSSPISVVARW
jgi:hypothetical protein